LRLISSSFSRAVAYGSEWAYDPERFGSPFENQILMTRWFSDRHAFKAVAWIKRITRYPSEILRAESRPLNGVCVTILNQLADNSRYPQRLA
jgi:hypothetical protein